MKDAVISYLGKFEKQIKKVIFLHHNPILLHRGSYCYMCRKFAWFFLILNQNFKTNIGAIMSSLCGILSWLAVIRVALATFCCYMPRAILFITYFVSRHDNIKLFASY